MCAPGEGIHQLLLGDLSVDGRETGGYGKAHPVAEILAGAPDPREYPASLIQPQDGPVWMLDRPAASGLS